MHRIAIFVEGYTELLFAEKLVLEIAGQKNVRIEKKRIQGGTSCARTVVTLESASGDPGAKFYVLLFDCRGDNQVKPRIREELAGLTNLGYWKVVGLRDIYPEFKRHDIPALRQHLKTGIPTKLAPVEIILAEMEVEAWFLSEHTHFERIDAQLTPALIEQSLGFSPERDDMTQRETPAHDLAQAYGLVNAVYTKGGMTTIEALDYAYLYTEVADKVSALNQLTSTIDEFLSISE